MYPNLPNSTRLHQNYLLNGKIRLMTEEFRKLNNQGLEEFKKWIAEGGKGLLPLHLLESRQHSVPTDFSISVDLPDFKNRFEFGKHLVEMLKHIPHTEIENDINFWSTLALTWFDSISNRTENGHRIVQEMARYILKLNWHDYRHLVKTPWKLVRLHDQHSKFLLVTSVRKEVTPLSVTNETLEQIGSRQTLLRNKQVIRVLSKLYYDSSNDQLKQKLFSKGGGTPHRTGIIVRQLTLTYDLEHMSERAIYDILPREFDRWKEGGQFD